MISEVNARARARERAGCSSLRYLAGRKRRNRGNHGLLFFFSNTVRADAVPKVHASWAVTRDSSNSHLQKYTFVPRSFKKKSVLGVSSNSTCRGRAFSSSTSRSLSAISARGITHRRTSRTHVPVRWLNSITDGKEE